MKLQIVGCSHHQSSLEVREQLAFSPDQARLALGRLRELYPRSEVVLLSTCNRMELYTASDDPRLCPSHREVVNFLAEFHGLDPVGIFEDLFEHSGEDAVRHLFTVAASLDSMVVGEGQILSQVKQAYDLAKSGNTTGPLTHAVFQAAIRVAKSVARDTAIQQKRVSIPSVAVADFASGVFDSYHDKNVLVVGAGEMAEETLTYLVAEGARHIHVVNRSFNRAEKLAEQFSARAAPWEELSSLLERADIIVSTTGATAPVITLESFQAIERQRAQRNLVLFDLAVPRDVEPEVGDCLGVYLYTIDDLQQTCEANRKAREKEWPKAEKIIEDETTRFMTDLNHRATGPTIRRLRSQADDIKNEELTRLLNKLADLDDRSQNEIRRSFDRLVNKMLHPPLETLRDAAKEGPPHGLLEALRDLFKIH